MQKEPEKNNNKQKLERHLESSDFSLVHEKLLCKSAGLVWVFLNCGIRVSKRLFLMISVDGCDIGLFKMQSRPLCQMWVMVHISRLSVQTLQQRSLLRGGAEGGKRRDWRWGELQDELRICLLVPIPRTGH